MNTIKLNFINRSNDVNNSDVVIFQKNVATTAEETAIAWTVITNCGPGWNHPFNYPLQSTVAASDSWGNYSPQLSASAGESFSVENSTSGDVLHLTGSASSAQEIEVKNNLTMGAVNANIFKDGRLFAIETSIAPGQKAVFEFKPTIFIGVVSQVQEGEVVNSAIISQVNTEISLLGLQSADIVMTGGGPGAQSTPFQFSLENINYA
jgi:hypothetical protein